MKVALTPTVKGEELLVDPTGTSGPVAGSVNCGASQTESMLRLAYKTMISPDRAITVVETMTGGGNGDPMQRNVASVAHEVALGLDNVEAAQRDYGVMITASGEDDASASVERWVTRLGTPLATRLSCPSEMPKYALATSMS